jgi:Type ISP C-terminal specificity domain/N-6 DNA Methylase
MAASPVDTYRREIERALQAGIATEPSYYPTLKVLLESLAEGVKATVNPKHVECGAPDFVVTKEHAHGPVTIGYLEAKDVGKDLDEVEKSEQLKRYLPALPNLILTDYLEFRWYVNGELRQTDRLARLGKGGKLAPEKNGIEAVTNLLTAFLTREAEPIDNPKTLALRMARLTHFIRDMIVTAFEKEAASVTLRDLHEAFEKALIPDLPIPQFADMFAQTLAYGLFAARCNHSGPTGSFKRLGAAAEIPKTNPFLRQLFETITGTALDDEPFVGFVDDLAQLLADTDIAAVLADFGRRTARQDPVVHFYETFLAAYDPKLRESRGVYYTPEPVVSYIVRSVDYLLKTRFGCPSGLADTATVEYEREEENGGEAKKVKATSPRVLILDPACGTGTFLYTVIDHIRAEFMRQGNAGMWSGYVRNHLLPRIFGFELLMAPYAVAHFKLGMQLAGNDLDAAQREKWAYDFSGDERLGVFLTNTLEEAERRAQMEFGFLRTLAEEANATLRIKRELPIMVVMGNPPYSNFGRMNRGKWILALLNDYKKDLHEKKLNLDDDFIKFIRFAQWRIDSTGAGILAFITNNTYIDGITHRRMRQSLMESFDEVYILDLHGNSNKKEKCPDGSKDENVFDIQQGVSIGIFVKRQDQQRSAAKMIHHSGLWGLRVDKYARLFETAVQSTDWIELEPKSPDFFFVPRRATGEGEFKGLVGIEDVFLVHQNAVKTDRDELFIDFIKDDLRSRMMTFYSEAAMEEGFRELYGIKDSSSYGLLSRRKVTKFDAANCRRFLYRPFDMRWLYYAPGLTSRPAYEVMQHMLSPRNIGIITTRQTRDKWDALVTSTICGHKSCAAYDINTLFPLYLYHQSSGKSGEQTVLAVETSHCGLESRGRCPNLNPEFVAGFAKRLGLLFVSDGKGDLKKTFGPEDAFNYIYAVFHCPTYRSRYAEFLKSDFPRVPLTSDANLFRSLCGLGAELVALHLLESPTLRKPIARFPVNGASLIEKGFPKFLGPREPEPGAGTPLKLGRVYINSSKPKILTGGQYFEGVSPEVWNFHIGGYQVCEKWLKDRRGRKLAYGELEHYSKVVTAIQETIRLMAEIDAVIPKWPMA